MDNSAALQAFAERERHMITQNIQSHGVHITYVASYRGGECAFCALEDVTDADVVDPFAQDLAAGAELPARLDLPLGYTTGLHSVGHPELVVLGLTPDLTAALLSAATQQVIAGKRLMPGQVVPHLAPPVLVEEIPNPGLVVLSANTYYGRSPQDSVPAQQLTWADLEGRFPWDEGHNTGRDQPRPGTYRA